MGGGGWSKGMMTKEKACLGRQIRRRTDRVEWLSLPSSVTLTDCIVLFVLLYLSLSVSLSRMDMAWFICCCCQVEGKSTTNNTTTTTTSAVNPVSVPDEGPAPPHQPLRRCRGWAFPSGRL